MGEGDRIILCTAEPHWIFAKMYNQYDTEINENNLSFWTRRVFTKQQIAVYLAGDLHHYRRHSTLSGPAENHAPGAAARFFIRHTAKM